MRDVKQAGYRALVERLLDGAGAASAEQRVRAFGDVGLAAPLDVLIDGVLARPGRVSEADFAAAKAAGFSEDQLFELVVCAAVGQSTRMYEAGLAALDEATSGGEGV